MEPPGFTPSRAERYSAYESIQHFAECDFLRALETFDNAIKSVGYIYWSGTLPDGEQFFSPISSLISTHSELIRQANAYKEILSVIHRNGFRIPSKQLVSLINAFVRVLRHCTDRPDWGLFDTLECQTRDCFAFIAENSGTSMPAEIYSTNLNEHIEKIIVLVCNDICQAVIRRENKIRLHEANPIPSPDGEEFTAEYVNSTQAIVNLNSAVKQVGDMICLTVIAQNDRLIGAMSDGNKDKFSVFGADATRTRMLLENRDTMSDKNVARQYLRGLCGILMDDPELKLGNGKSVKTPKDAVRYVMETRLKDKDSVAHGGVVGNFLDVANKHGWKKESTIYQNVKNLGSESLTNKGLAKKAKSRKKKEHIAKDLAELAKELP